MKNFLFIAMAIALSHFAYTQGCSVNYIAPSFQLTKTNPSCTANSGSISVVNPQDGILPYSYRIIETNTFSATGVFTGLSSGVYTVEMRDSCGTIRTRQATLLPYNFSFQFTINRTSDCNDGQISVVPSPMGSAYEYAVISPSGDTTWNSSDVFDIKLFHTLTILAKDACGNIVSQTWTAPPGFLPYIAEIQHNLQCSKFDLFVVDYGFTDPTYCLYSAEGKLITCQSTPNFFNVPYGDYYFIVSDKCFRDSMFQPNMVSEGGSQLDPYNWSCSTFTMHVDGMEDTVCLYDAITNRLVSCKGQDTTSLNPRTGLPWPSGAVWDSLPYGSYYAWIYDPCMDSTFRIDSTVIYNFKVQMTGLPACLVNGMQALVDYDPASKKPYTTTIFNGDGTLNSSYVTNSTNNNLTFIPNNSQGQMMVVGTDACGSSDTAFIDPRIMRLTKSISIVNKCPGLSGVSGSGDVTIQAAKTELGAGVTPTIVKKNGVDVSITFNQQTNDSTYKFIDLESGTYIVKYALTGCSSTEVRDTFTIQDYVYPSQPPIQVYQCFINQFLFRDTITGGLNPFTYQIIGSTPALPSLVSATQGNPIFAINPGAAYQNIRVRAVDACGNSTIGDVTVAQMAGCEVLAVDSLPGRQIIENKLAKVYPNPSNGKFYISFSQRKKSNYRVQINNVGGVKVFETILNNVDRKDYIIDNELSPGFYIITVEDLINKKQSTFKHVIR